MSRYGYNDANVCINNGISFELNNNIYTISTSYIIDYPKKIKDKLYKLNNVNYIQNVPECNWYTVNRCYNTGINTGTIYIQGPNYSVKEIEQVSNILNTEYPITETLIAISFGLILPILLLFLFCYYPKFYSKQSKQEYKDPIKTIISNEIQEHFFNVPNYDNEKFNELYFYDKYKECYHNYIKKEIEKYTNINYNIGKCNKCNNEKKILYQTKYNLYLCELCNL